MKRKILRILFCIILFCPLLLNAQKGFLGKRNAVSLELLDIAKQTQFDLNYQFCLGPSWSADLELLKGFQTTPEYSDAMIELVSGSYTQYYNYKLDYDLSFNNFGWGLGLSTNGFAITNMPAPFGYYINYGYVHNSTTMSVDIKNIDNSYPLDLYKDKKIEFPIKSNIIKITYGKKSMIGKFFTFDIGLELGFDWGKILNEKDQGLQIGYKRVYPIPFSKILFPTTEIQNKYNNNTRTFMFFFFNPVIRIGYLF